MKAKVVTTITLKRHSDPIFGKVDRFRQVKEHRVQIQIGRMLFTSNNTYSSVKSARVAAARMEGK